MIEKKKTSWGKRIFGLLFVVAGIVILVAGPIMEKRTDRKVRAMLLQIQEGLQRYHIDEEIYPRRMQRGGSLVALLEDEGHLELPVINPWSGERYAFEADPDYLLYRTDELAETYELVVTFPGSEEVQFRLDSTKNRSLE